MIKSYGVEADISKELYETEKRNLSKLGYGVKSFTLSMIESAHHLTQGNIGSGDTAKIIQWGKELLHHPVNLLPGVVDVLSYLQNHFAIYVITKGDAFHQQQKFLDSGLATYITDIEILLEKNRVKLTFCEAWHFELIFGQFLVFFLVTLRVIPSADSSISIFVGQKTHHYQIMSENTGCLNYKCAK